jgi:hypothetical protein
MMYNSKMAMAIKVNGRILREFDGNSVKLPYGCEYSLLIKNLNSVRVQVKVSIDGTDATEGTALVIQPNSEIDFKRFIKNGNFEKGNSFKFIERTESIEQARGIKIDDGLVRVEFQFEKPYQAPSLLWNYQHDWNRYGSPSIMTNSETAYYGSVGSASGSLTNAVASSQTAYAATASNSILRGGSASAVAQSANANEAGITVPGSENNQKFMQASWFPVEAEKHVMIMKLVGESSGQKVVEAVTVKAKPKCSTCGRVNKATSKFCVNCGTSLQLF